MCIVIDANTFASIFNINSADHQEYRPVKDWVTNGCGFIVYGGTKYKKELERATKYLRIIVELRKAGRVKEIDDMLVDEHQAQVEALVNDVNCNDAHLIAIFRVSRCRLLCSNNLRSDRYVKDRSVYMHNQRPPLIYRGRRHRNLLCSRYIVSLHHVV